MAKAIMNLESLLGERSLLSLAKATGIDYKTIYKLAKGNAASIRFDHITLLCDELKCSPADLITLPEKKKSRKK